MEWKAEVKEVIAVGTSKGTSSLDEPAPTILTHGRLHTESERSLIVGKPLRSMIKLDTSKPPYRVPLMSEITQLPWNGLKVVSTFSGAGGSCTGYRMAGYKVIWANEFVPAAQASYKANAASDSILDPRDIRTVQASEILQATGLKGGELDLFDGSPPCQAFSTAGKREKGWGKGKTYEHGAVQKNEELFTEYIRLLRGLQPKVFVVENVSGLIKGTAKGYFLEILRELKASGYRVTCKLLDAQWLGVPQMRQRTIFVGVREDLGLDPVHPEPLPYRYSVRDAVPWIINHSIKPTGTYEPKFIDSGSYPAQAIATTTQGGSGSVESAASVMNDTGGFAQRVDITNRPCPAITSGIDALNSTHYLVAGQGNADTQTGRKPDGIERRKFTIAELKRICAFPDDFILTGSYAQQWERLGNSVPPVMMFHIAKTIQEKIFLASSYRKGDHYEPRCNL